MEQQGAALVRIRDLANRQFREIEADVFGKDDYPFLLLQVLPGEYWRLDYQRAENSLRRGVWEPVPEDPSRIRPVSEATVWGFTTREVIPSVNFLFVVLGNYYAEAALDRSNPERQAKAIRGSRAFEKDVRRFNRRAAMGTLT